MAEATRNVLVPIDESEHAEYAFRWALANVLRPGDVIHLATVGDVPMTYSTTDRTRRTPPYTHAHTHAHAQSESLAFFPPPTHPHRGPTRARCAPRRVPTHTHTGEWVVRVLT
jgi:hypothetical protein